MTPRSSPALSVAVLAAALLLAGCLGGPGGDPGWRFVEVTDEAGFDETVGEMIDPGTQYMKTLTGGVSAADVDGDGWTDLFVADVGRNLLYMNQGDGTFREAAAEAGVAGSRPSMMGLFFDYDGDGDPDLYEANRGARGRLLENAGDGTFRDVTEEAGLGAYTWATGATAADVDGDGDLDLTVVNYNNRSRKEPPSTYTNATNGPRDLLYINQGDGTFVEEARRRGIDATRWSFGHAWADYDTDGDPDLYVNVDFGRDLLYENEGNGTFHDVARKVGTVTDENGMGAVWTDVDNDRDLDLFATNIHMPRVTGWLDHFEGNDLFLQEDDAFRDVARERGVHAGGWGWDSAWADLDHDGDVDGYQANGMFTRTGRDLYYDSTVRVTDEPLEPARHRVPLARYNESTYLYLTFPDKGAPSPSEHSVAGHQVDRLFRNRGGGHFEDVAGQVGFETWSDTRTVALVDHDRDGDLDIARTAFDRPLQLFENRAVEAGDGDAHWLQVDLVGTTSNRQAVGARVMAEAGDRTMLRQVTAGHGFMSQDQHALHLGLGGQTSVDELRITWPSGETVTLENVSADQRIRVTEPARLETSVGP